ncbi:TonB-dependent receptor domain-containing protein [Novosphingobium mangrovi (ex Huang et al. 2023)]|uniref:TonB-dependent receptor n=1 Tax=Novosphingobium mangrovi (ex Huang et al. 2023) TaxID=2976432 RepID=A0ABT2I4W7_9SPHN|nr:TonB-dependent receptor [Novosphingobium mangrovi (ex Huang et al. 2023)]MCT2399858.1 TonB-dependent receptor [Novosphingobium mangrovi (ex Huang et al. 2023)]
MKKYLFLLGSTLVAATPAMAAEANDTIVVTATREPTPVTQIGQSVSVVTRDEIERSQATTATDVLARIPGLATAQSGGFGQPSSVFIRGADNAQSLVLIDGVRINDPGDVGGGFNFGSLTIAQFDRVEVVRGSSGVIWGSRAMGGVINFITARPTEQWHARAQAEYGWRDRRQASLSAAGKLGPVGLTLGGNWMKGDGYSAFDEALGGTEKDGFESKSANARAEVELTQGLSVDAGGYWTKANYDYDNTGADALNVGLKRDALGYANLRYKGLDGRLNARVGYGLTDTRRVSDDAVWGPYETNGRVERFEGQASFAPIEMVSVLVGAETEKQKFDDNYGSKDSTSIDSVYGNLTLRPLAGLTLNGGLRYDDNSDFGDRTTFAANGAWVIGSGDDAPVLRASYGEGFKAPSLYQLYTNAGFRALDPETSKGWDVGIEQPFAEGTGRFTVTYFDRKTKNLIDYDFASWNYYNIGRTRAQGVELGMQVVNWNGFDVNLAYTYLDATDETTGAQLARRPKNNFYASIDKAWEVGLKLGADLRVGGGRYDDMANFNRLEGFTVVGLRGAFTVTDNIEVYGRVENLFDKHYEVVRTYGTPGRSAYAGVRVKM